MRDTFAKKKRHALFLTVIFITITGILLYIHTIQFPFHFDDNHGIVNNPWIYLEKVTVNNLHKACFSGNYPHRPLANLSFALNYYVHQLNVSGYHWVNIGLHIINGILVFFLFQFTLQHLETGRHKKAVPAWATSRNTLAALAAFLWLAHPLHTQSVTYILQRMNVLATTFYLLSLWCYIQARQRRQNNMEPSKTVWLLYAMTALAAVCAWSSKQNTACLPFFLLFYEWYFLSRPENLRLRLKKIAIAAVVFGILALVYLGPRPLEQIDTKYAEQSFTMAERLLTQPRVVIFYVSLIAYPHPLRLNLDHDFRLSQTLLTPAGTTLAITAVAFLVIGAVLGARKHRLLSFAILWFLGNLVIESSFIGNELIFEHRTYLPSIFLFLAAGRGLQRRLPLPAFFVAAMILALLASSLWTCQRNFIWRTPFSLWRDCLDKSPNKARPHHNLAAAYKNRNQLHQALDHYHQALDLFSQSARPDLPRIAQTCNSLGETYNHLNHYPRARHFLQKALGILYRHTPAAYPEIVDTYNNLGAVYSNQQRYHQALEYFEKALHICKKELGPDHPDTALCYNNLGNMYQKLGVYDKATACFRKTLDILQHHPDPRLENLPITCNNLGVAYSLSGEYDKAITAFRQALELYRRKLESDHPMIAIHYTNLAQVYADKGDHDRARQYYRQAYHIFSQRLGENHAYTRQAEKNMRESRKVSPLGH